LGFFTGGKVTKIIAVSITGVKMRFE